MYTKANNPHASGSKKAKPLVKKKPPMQVPKTGQGQASVADMIRASKIKK
jgi:hypothetical protein